MGFVAETAFVRSGLLIVSRIWKSDRVFNFIGILDLEILDIKIIVRFSRFLLVFEDFRSGEGVLELGNLGKLYVGTIKLC